MKNLFFTMLLFILITGNVFAQYPGGNALDFDGVNDYVEINDSPNLDIVSNLTISAWIYGNNYEENDLFVHKINAYGISVRSGGSVGLLLSQNPSGTVWEEFSSNFVPSAEEWYHFAATYDASAQEVKLYINGDLKNTITYSTPIASSTGALYFGGYWGGQIHQGIIDEVRIWDITRSQEQIISTISDTLGTQYYSTIDSGLVGYWRFDEGTPGGVNTGVITLPDLTIYGNHGTLNDFALTGDNSNWVSSDAPISDINNFQLNIPIIPQLIQNYPNPFNPSTTINFTLPEEEFVTLEIYNPLGQKIESLINKSMSAGAHQVEFSAKNLPSGIYFYKIEAGEFQQVRKMVLIK